jgi:membrane fusion protein (multidrug efflux system)
MKFNFFITESEYLESSALLKSVQDMPLADRKALLSLKLANGSVYPERGTFYFINRQVNSSTGAIQVTGLFPNPTGVLRPGLFAMVTAPVKELKGALLVPQKATVELQGNYFVSVVEPGNTVKTIPIKLGPQMGQLRVIEGALTSGESVIVEGVEKVRPGMKVDPLPYQLKEPAATPTPAPAATPTPTAKPSPAATATPAAAATPETN